VALRFLVVLSEEHSQLLVLDQRGGGSEHL
jgi:hypothetical protein